MTRLFALIPDSTPPALAELKGTPAGRLHIEPLGILGLAYQVPTTTASTNTVLSPTASRISLYARGSAMRIAVGSTNQVANATTSHYMAAGDRLDIALPATPRIAVIRAADSTVDGVAEISELS